MFTDSIVYNIDIDALPRQTALGYLRIGFSELKEIHPLRSNIPQSWPTDAAIIELARRTFNNPISRLDAILRYPTANHWSLSPNTILSSKMPYMTYMLIYFPYLTTCFDTLAMLDALLAFEPGTVETSLAEFRSLVHFAGPNTRIRMHSVLQQFFVTESKSGQYFTDVRTSHELLVRGYTRLLNRIKSTSLSTPTEETVFVALLMNLYKASFKPDLQVVLRNFNFMLFYKKYESITAEYCGDSMIDDQILSMSKPQVLGMFSSSTTRFLTKEIPDRDKLYDFHVSAIESAYGFDVSALASLNSLLAKERFSDWIRVQSKVLKMQISKYVERHDRRLEASKLQAIRYNWPQHASPM
ncbi:hypothetical protein BDN70DRAFT_932911 [Pholiota conissans]|uniref:Uncharacterized protein n=1 Tax=Pholiota conissans TaxID=109636 RepID=A0A9P6D0T5_9AGAR|nr:hypothetical protein BDN70DRAFT_932911 [Pholiota conissans]